MSDVHTQFDTSDTPEPDDLEPVEVGVTEETGESFGEEKERLATEGFESVRERFNARANSETSLFGDETARLSKSIEGRYDIQMEAEDIQETQHFMERAEGLRSHFEADMTAVSEDSYTPNPEKHSAHAQLREKRDALDQEWEILSETVALEGADESKMKKYALKSGEDLPPMSESGKRLNQVMKEIFAIDKKLASLSGPTIEATPPQGSDKNPILLTEEMKKPQPEAPPTTEKPRAVPPPPPGAEGRAEWLRAKAVAESDPVKKAEWTMKALDEQYGSSDMVFEKKEAPSEIAEKPATETPIETPAPATLETTPPTQEKPTGNTAEMWQALYPDEDFTSSDSEAVATEKPDASKVVSPQENPAVEAPPELVKQETPTPAPVEKPVAKPQPEKDSKKASNEELMSHLFDAKDESPEASPENEVSDPRETTLDLMEDSAFLAKLGSEEMTKTTQSWIANYRKGVLGPNENPENEIAKLKFQAEDFKDLASFTSFLKREGETHPELSQIAKNIDSLSDEDIEGILEGYQTAVKDEILILEKELDIKSLMAEDIASAMSEDLADVMNEEDDPEVLAAMQKFVDKKGLDIPKAEAQVTHSERHEVNAETFGKLVQELDIHLENLVANDIDLSTLKSSEQLLEALGNSGVISKEDALGLKTDHMRRNVLMSKFKKLKSNHRKK